MRSATARAPLVSRCRGREPRAPPRRHPRRRGPGRPRAPWAVEDDPEGPLLVDVEHQHDGRGEVRVDRPGVATSSMPGASSPRPARRPSSRTVRVRDRPGPDRGGGGALRLRRRPLGAGGAWAAGLGRDQRRHPGGACRARSSSPPRGAAPRSPTLDVRPSWPGAGAPCVALPIASAIASSTGWRGSGRGSRGRRAAVGDLLPGALDGGARSSGWATSSPRPAGEPGVPLQLEGRRAARARPRRSRGRRPRRAAAAVATDVRGGDDGAQGLAAVVEGRPGHGQLLVRMGVHTVGSTQSMEPTGVFKRLRRDAAHLGSAGQ